MGMGLLSVEGCRYFCFMVLRMGIVYRVCVMFFFWRGNFCLFWGLFFLLFCIFYLFWMFFWWKGVWVNYMWFGGDVSYCIIFWLMVGVYWMMRGDRFVRWFLLGSRWLRDIKVKSWFLWLLLEKKLEVGFVSGGW